MPTVKTTLAALAIALVLPGLVACKGETTPPPPPPACEPGTPDCPPASN